MAETSVHQALNECILERDALAESRAALVEALEKALPVLKDAVIAQGALPAGHPAFQGIGRLQARADQARAALDAAKATA